MASLTLASNTPSSISLSPRLQAVQPPKSVSFAPKKCFTLTPRLTSQSFLQLQPQTRLSSLTTYATEVDVSAQLAFTPEIPPVAPGKKQVLERLVLFIMLPGVPRYRVDRLLEGLKALASNESVTFLTAGPLHRYNPDPYIFDIFLHARFKTYEERVSYLSTGQYLNLHHELMDDICTEVLLQEWFADVDEHAFPEKGGAIRTTFYKLKEGRGEEHKDEILKVVSQLDKFHGTVLQHTYGKNFTPKPADHKGYSVASLSVFPNKEELDAFARNEKYRLHLGKIKHHLDDVAHFDYLL